MVALNFSNIKPKRVSKQPQHKVITIARDTEKDVIDNEIKYISTQIKEHGATLQLVSPKNSISEMTEGLTNINDHTQVAGTSLTLLNSDNSIDAIYRFDVDNWGHRRIFSYHGDMAKYYADHSHVTHFIVEVLTSNIELDEDEMLTNARRDENGHLSDLSKQDIIQLVEEQHVPKFQVGAISETSGSDTALTYSSLNERNELVIFTGSTENCEEIVINDSFDDGYLYVDEDFDLTQLIKLSQDSLAELNEDSHGEISLFEDFGNEDDDDDFEDDDDDFEDDFNDAVDIEDDDEFEFDFEDEDEFEDVEVPDEDEVLDEAAVITEIYEYLDQNQDSVVEILGQDNYVLIEAINNVTNLSMNTSDIIKTGVEVLSLETLVRLVETHRN